MREIRDDAANKLTATLLELLEKGTIDRGELLEFIECSMYEATMQFTKGNQVNAAQVIGVSRGTLRSKLKQFFSTTLVGGLYHNKLSKFTQYNKIQDASPSIEHVVLLKDPEQNKNVAHI